MKIEPQVESKLYFSCPNGCAHRFYHGHLVDDFERLASKIDGTVHAGPWHCDDCGQGWMLRVSADGAVDVEKARTTPEGDGKLYRSWVTLEIPAGSPAIRFRVRGMYRDPTDPSKSNRYFYDEGTCPVNWLKEVVEVEMAGDKDPHGFARYVSTVRVEDAKGVCRACGQSIDEDKVTCSSCKAPNSEPTVQA